MNEEINYPNENFDSQGNPDHSSINEPVKDSIQKAGFFRRCAAAIIDHAICFMLFILIVIVFFKEIIFQVFFSSIYFSGCFLVMTLITEIYYFSCEYYLNGLTPGKKLFGIRVINVENELKITSILIRNFLRCTYLISPLFFIPDLIFIAFDKKGRRIGDLIAGTVVVKKFIG